MSKDFVRYAKNHYIASYYTEKEFNTDLSKVVVLKKMFRRYQTTGDLNERVVLNNIIIMLNVFGIKATNVILFFKIDREFYGTLKSFLVFLDSYEPNYITDLVEFDDFVLARLEEIRGRSFINKDDYE